MNARPATHWGRCLVCGKRADRDVCPDCLAAMLAGEAAVERVSA